MRATSSACPMCGRAGHPLAGLHTSRWVEYRETVPVVRRDEHGQELPSDRMIYRYGKRMEGTQRFVCECGQTWTQDRPATMQTKRPARARPRRGF